MSEDQLKELIPFLHDKNPQVRQIALSNLLGQTPKGSPHRDIFLSGLPAGGLQRAQDSDVVRDLKLLCRDQLATAHDAFRALVNLSDNSLLVGSLSEPSFFGFLVSYILNFQSTLADLASMLLSNLTVSAATCSALLSLNVSMLPDPKSPIMYFPVQSRCGTCPAPVPYPPGEPQDVLALPLLVDAFVQGAVAAETEDVDKRLRRGDLHFLSSVFANLSITTPGRMFFMTPRPADPTKSDGNHEYPLSKLLVFTEHKDTIRRGGVASTIKNCAFYVQAHHALLSPDSTRVTIPPSTLEALGLDILPYVLLPLAGPEEFDLEDQELLPPALQFLPPTKKREPDPVLRLTHVETLLLLSTTRWGRDHLRNNGVYEVIRALHENEEVDEVSEHVERLVNLLKRDEGPDTAQGGQIPALESSARINEVDDDDEDNRIEEI
ncbi:Protein HGH1 homolog [Sparassis crispa]|uniref:Protein HGH1 homolog n=1 Tax=Sparassis crispa TaxID=139825 RepID=A0A401GWL6_9APHY|nr:Protein HGH1 homolog [Sparassis crispa]GBE86618.1 Protein HGH1 homolog [Sparassis crispa]